ncbi:MAG: ferritin [Candidatus Moraniibacteriota bacterium]|nr:MAG: ferritin [Candidatus Moranbacteria bacterium]
MLHEEREKLSHEVLDMKRAIDSLREELEAIDWYNQRAEASNDTELRAILEHNRDEEKEHAAMLLAWIGKRDSHFSHELSNFLGGEGKGENILSKAD